MLTLEEYYLALAEEYTKKNMPFEAAYYRHAAFEVSCYE